MYMVKKFSHLPELAVDFSGEESAVLETKDLESELSADIFAVKPEEVIVELVSC